MKKGMICTIAILLAALCLTGTPAGAGVSLASADTNTTLDTADLQKQAQRRDVMAVVYLCRSYVLRETCGGAEPKQKPTALTAGSTVRILDADLGKDGSLWLKVGSLGAEPFEGWMERRNLAISDERFLKWEKSNVPKAVQGADRLQNNGDGVSEDIAQFPESYQAGLTALKQQHANWVFVPQQTGLDWNTAVTEELKNGKSMVYVSLPEWTHEGNTGQTNWFYASREILEYYMDPRNSMTENAIFQFEQLTFNSSYHTLEAVEAFLSSTFMASPTKAPGTALTHATIIYYIGKAPEISTSPYHMAARIIQEQGTAGKSQLISGTYPGYEGYYNYFNVGANGATSEQVIVNGLKYAKSKDWSSAYSSIWGGAELLSANYIRKGQDTLYLQKYNVAPDSAYAPYTHQYMQNISAAYTEAKSIRNLYNQVGCLDSPFVFKIPVYENMPKSTCQWPEKSDNVVIELPADYLGNTVVIDGKAYVGERRNGYIITRAADSNAQKTVLNVLDTGSKTLKQYVYNLTYSGNCYKAVKQDATVSVKAMLISAPTQSVGTELWIDGVAVPCTTASGYLAVEEPSSGAGTATAYCRDASGATTHTYIWELNYADGAFGATMLQGLADLTLEGSFSLRLNGSPGIRYLSDIGESVRNALLANGVDGYQLKEYGTLAMVARDHGALPLVLGGKKTAGTLAFRKSSGLDISQGVLDSRVRFAGVMTGIPADQYRTDMVFRSYFVLEKNGKEVVVYGPEKVQSMCGLAQAILDKAVFAKDSEEDELLRKMTE